MFEMMIYPFLALVGVALLSGAYGCQMMWHKVAMLGDALSHGALLGLAVGVFIGVDENVSLFLLSILWAFLLWALTKNRRNSVDTAMAFLVQASLALAILLYAVAGKGSAALMHAFLGDVLMVDKTDLWAIGLLDCVLFVVLIFCWKKWVLMAISPDLAKAQKINTGWQQFIFFVCIGFFVAIAMKLLGALLAPAFFIMPALIARPLSKTPEKMAVLASIIAIVAAIGGLGISFYQDLPTGATIIGVCLGLYAVVLFYGFIKQILTKQRAY